MIKKDIIDALYEAHGGMNRDEIDRYTNDLLDVLTGCSAFLAGAIYVAYCLNRPDRREMRGLSVPPALVQAL